MDMNGIVGLGGCGIIHNGEVSLFLFVFFFSFEIAFFPYGIPCRGWMT